MLYTSLRRTLSQYYKKAFVRYAYTVDAINGVDLLSRKKVNCIPEPQENLIVSGWFLDAKEDQNILEFFIEIAGKKYPALYGLLRTDVSFEFKVPRFRDSGFRCVMDKKDFQPGKVYDIRFVLKNRQNRVRTIPSSIRFAIDGEKAVGGTGHSNERLEYSQYVCEMLARRYIAGTGVEIGALHAPLSVDGGKARVLYVDRMSQEDLYRQYPEFKKYDIVAADIIDNGDELGTIADNQYDFCISNHVLEHLEDPVKALVNWLRILKPQGILFLSVPLPKNIVDRHRQPTELAHLIGDYRLMATDKQRYAERRQEHFRDFVRATHSDESLDAQAIEDKTRELMDRDYSIHFHVFSEATLTQLVEHVSAMIAMRIVEFVLNEPEEYILVIEKQSAMTEESRPLASICSTRGEPCSSER